MGSIPIGGQTFPNSMLGTKLEWNKAQKKAINRNISLTINNENPTFIPLLT